MKITARIITLIITLTMLCSSALSIFARADDAEITEPLVKLSDIFWAYDTDYLYSDLFESHSNDTFAINDEIYTYYVQNLSISSILKDSILLTTDLKDWINNLIQSGVAPNLSYYDAMDAANVELASHLMGDYLLDNTEFVENVSDEISDFLSWSADKVEDFKDEKDPEILANFVQNFFTHFADAFTDRTIFYYATKQVGAEWSNQLKQQSGTLGLLSDIAEGVQAVSIGILMEKCRVDIIDDILANIPKNCYLYEGLTRLKSSIGQNAFAHIAGNYFSTTFIKNIVSMIINEPGIYKLVAGVIKISSWVVFDIILNTPSSEELVTQHFLTQYSKDMYYYLCNKIEVFRGQFTIKDIETFAIAFDAYIGVTNAALEASDNLSHLFTSDLNAIQNKYSNISFSYYIDDISNTIYSIPKTERKLQDHGDWIITSPIKLSHSSGHAYDSIGKYLEADTLYLLDGKFKANLILRGQNAQLTNLDSFYMTLNGDLSLSESSSLAIPAGNHFQLNGNCSISNSASLTIAQDEYFTINGNLDMTTSGRLTVMPFSKLTITGDCTIKYYADITNYAEFICLGDFSSTNAYGYSGTFTQDHSMAKFIAKGDVYFSYPSYSKISNGYVIFDGDTQQSVSNLDAANVKVVNFEGIKYLTNIQVRGHYSLTGNPLDDGNYYTIIYDTTSFGAGDFYNKLKITSPVNMKAVLPGDVYVEGTDASLSINGEQTFNILGCFNASSSSKIYIGTGSTLTVNDYIKLSTSASMYINNGAKLNSIGPLSLTYYSSITNNGDTVCYDDIITYTSNGYSGTFLQSEANATLTLKKNIQFCSTYSSKITGGTVIFDGEQTQQIYNLSAYNITVLNPTGVKYLTNVYLYGNYSLNSHPLDDGSYYTYMSDGATFADGSDYKKIYAYGNVTLRSNIPGTLYIDGSSNTLTILSDTQYNIEDVCYVRYSGKLIVEDNAELHFKSNLEITYYANVINNGTIICDKDLRSYNTNGYQGTFTQNNPNALLILKQNFSFGYPTYSCITAGKVIFSSDFIQTVANLSAYNVEVNNPCGIQYLSDIHVYGKYTIGDSPLNDGSYYTNIYNSTSFGDTSDYKKIRVNDVINLNQDLPGDVYLNSTGSMISVPKNAHYSIFGDLYTESGGEVIVLSSGSLSIIGNVTIRHSAYITVNKSAALSANGDITILNNSILTNNGRIVCYGNFTSKYASSNYGYYTQNQSNSILEIKGNYSFPVSETYTSVTAGTVIFSGQEQQTVSGLYAYNIEVTNPLGIKYMSNVYQYGHYNLNQNPLDCSSYYTYIYQGATFEGGSDYKKINVSENMTMIGDIPGDLYVTNPHGRLKISDTNIYTISGNLIINGGYVELINGTKLIVGSSVTVSINGELYTDKDSTLDIFENCTTNNYGILRNDGTVIVRGNLSSTYSSSNYGYLIQNNADAEILVYKNVSFVTPQTYCRITDGKLVLCGNTLQTINGLLTKDLSVQNTTGIKYASNVYVKGKYELNGYPLDSSNYATYIYSTTTLFSDSYYNKVIVDGNVTLTTDIYGDLHVSGSTAKLTIDESSNISIFGNCTVESSGKLTVMDEASLLIDGNFNINTSASTINYGHITINGNLGYTSSSSYGTLTQYAENATLRLSGNCSFMNNSSCRILDGTVIFNGSEKQTVRYLNAPIIILENKSDNGVEFTTPITPSVLFNHNGNKFTLTSSAANSTFVDYDGDEIPDNIDKHPTSISDECSCIKVTIKQPTCAENGIEGMICTMCSSICEQWQTPKLNSLSGDADEDGELTNTDITLLVRYLSGWDVQICTYCADSNIDGKLDNRDIIVLIKKTLGYN